MTIRRRPISGWLVIERPSDIDRGLVAFRRSRARARRMRTYMGGDAIIVRVFEPGRGDR